MGLAPGTQMGRYEVLAPLGAGGMGEVYRARDARIGRDVALKVLPAAFSNDPARLRRFEQETRLAGQLNHPNILVIYDVGTHEGLAYFVAELLEGETLRQRLLARSPSLRTALDYAVQLARGLAAAHAKGIVHRDLKPENVFISAEGQVKILDFGLAKSEPARSSGSVDSETTTVSGGTLPGTVLGTVGYMSPEQIRGQPADHRSDIFSYGAILYEMFAGARAFQRASPAETLSAILRDDPPELLNTHTLLPRALLSIVSRCLEKEPENRFESIRDVGFSLSAYAGSTEDEARGGVEPGQSPARSTTGKLAANLGGEGSPTFRRLTFRRGLVMAARFAPDGQTIHYSAAWDGQPFRIFTVRGERPESAALPLPDASLLAVSSTGEMAVLLGLRMISPVLFGGTLARVSVLGGTPRELLDGVKWGDWSPDGSSLAIVRRVGSKERLEYPIGNTLYETDGWITEARVAPAGDWVAFVDHVLEGYVKSSIMIVNRKSERRNLSTGWTSAYSLAWSSAGAEVWFTASTGSEPNSLYAVSLSRDVRLLYRAPVPLRVHHVAPNGTALMTTDSQRVGILVKGRGDRRERDLSWLNSSAVCDISEDGNLLLFNERPEYAGGSRPGIYLRKTDGSPAVRLGEGVATGLSPDRKWVLSISPDVPVRIVLLPVGAGQTMTVASGVSLPESAAWFPDGRRLVVQGRAQGRDSQLYVQELEKEGARAISPEGVRLVGSHSVSADGRVVVGQAADRTLHFFPVEGGDAEPVQGVISGDRFVRWTADGAMLYVFRRAELPSAIVRVDTSTGRREIWKQLAPPDPAGVLGIQAMRLTSDGKSYAYSYWSGYSDLYLVEGLS